MRLPLRPRLVPFVLAAAAFAAVPALAPLRAQDVATLCEELEKLDKEGDEGKTIAKLEELANNNDPAVTAAIVDLAKTSKSDKVAALAIGRAAARKDPAFLKWLKSKLDDKKLAEDKPDRYQAVLQSIGEYRDKSTLKGLEDVVSKYLKTNPAFATRAIHSYAAVREKAVIEQLLKWLGETESGTGGGGGGKVSTQTRDALAAAKNSIISELQELSGQDISDAGTWKTWWEENKKDFVFRDPNAPEVDVTALTTFEDPAYGFTVKRPEMPDWTFEKVPDDKQNRVRLTFRVKDAGDYARADYIIWNTAGRKDTNSVPSLLAHFEKDWRETPHFETFSKEPSVETRKFGNREWQMLDAKGLATGPNKGWGGVQMRVYATNVNQTLILYVIAKIRTGAEVETNEAFWKSIEGTTFKK